MAAVNPADGQRTYPAEPTSLYRKCQDPQRISCAAKFRKATGSKDDYGSAGTANFVRRDGAWMHIAVTWTAANDGLTTIYQNGAVAAGPLQHAAAE